MSTNPFGETNPYSSPVGYGGGPSGDPNAVRGKVLAPAIALIVVAGLGLLGSLFNVVFALTANPIPPDPNAPEFLQALNQNTTGPTTAIIQSAFAILNLVIIAGGVQMARMEMRPFAIVASVLAMANFGTCCCILGLPVGIWSLVILLLPDVAAAFRAKGSV
jgi:hypothetical protein